MKPRGAGRSAPGLVVVLLDQPLYHGLSKSHNFFRPQLLTNAVSSPVAAVETDWAPGSSPPHMMLRN